MQIEDSHQRLWICVHQQFSVYLQISVLGFFFQTGKLKLLTFLNTVIVDMGMSEKLVVGGGVGWCFAEVLGGDCRMGSQA